MRFDAPPSRAVTLSGNVARPRSLTVAGAAQALESRIEDRSSILPVPHLFPDYPALKEVGAGTWNRVAASIKPAATREVYSITFAAAARIPATAKRACCAAISGTRATKSG
jgi:hypothetical protein